MDNIKMDLGETDCDLMDWIDVAHDKGEWMTLVNRVVKFLVPQRLSKSQCQVMNATDRVFSFSLLTSLLSNEYPATDLTQQESNSKLC
jgi:hypothetical protein